MDWIIKWLVTRKLKRQEQKRQARRKRALRYLRAYGISEQDFLAMNPLEQSRIAIHIARNYEG